MATLYVVATPIGNLEDVTLRALRVLGEVGLIAAEDTRITKRLLSRYDISTPLTSYHEHNRAKKLPSLLSALETGDMALVSDAGVPGISDPGAELVTAVAEAGHRVVPVPGPSAVTSALSVSGLRADRFVGMGARDQGDLQGAVSERRPMELAALSGAADFAAEARIVKVGRLKGTDFTGIELQLRALGCQRASGLSSPSCRQCL